MIPSDILLVKLNFRIIEDEPELVIVFFGMFKIEGLV